MIASDLGAPGLRLQGRDVEPVLRSESAVTGVVGIAERGPLNLPQPVYSWGQFLQIFGDFVDYGYLAEAVFGFFLNGGEKCWGVRVADLRDRSSENPPERCPKVVLLIAASDTALEDRNGDPTIRFSAINQGSWGNAIRYDVFEESPREIELTALREGVQGSGSTFPVESALDFAPGQIFRLTHASNPFIQREYKVASVDVLTNTISISGAIGEDFPIGSAIFGRGFRVIVQCGDQEEVFEDLSMTAAHERYFARVINGEPDATEYLTRLKRGNSILVRVEHLPGGGQSRFRPVAATRSLSGGGDGFTQAEGTLRNGSNQLSLRVVATSRKGTGGNGMRVTATPFGSPIALPVPLTSGERDRFSSADAQLLRLGEVARLRHLETPSVTETRSITSIEPDGFVHLTSDLSNDYPIGSSASIEGRFDLFVYGKSDAEPRERFRNLRMSPATSDGFVKRELEVSSTLICADPTNPPAIPRGEVALGGGVDPGEIDLRYYTGYEEDGGYFVSSGGDPDRRLGLATLERVDEVSLVTVPDLSRGLTGAMDEGVSGGYSFVDAQKLVLFHCSKMGERMALLHLMPEASLEDAASWPANFSEPRFAKFGALYYPWLLRTVGGNERWVPPCGLVAGAFSSSDRLHGVGKAPANLPLLGVASSRVDLDRAEQDGLNPRGVNCIRKLNDGQVNLMGSRTLAPRLNTRYVNARRVLLTIVKTLSKRLLWTVFEPNDPDLWKRIEATLTSFLTALVSKGMTASSLPGEAFFVKCDAETNSAASIDAGEVHAEIGVALTAPAEFILITARRTPESLNIIEEEH